MILKAALERRQKWCPNIRAAFAFVCTNEEKRENTKKVL
jgi:hypothetical protein